MAKVTGQEMAVGVGRLQVQLVPLALVYAGATCRLGGAKPRAAEQSRTMRRLSAGSGFSCRESCGSSMKHFSLVLQEPGRLPLELDERLG